MPTRLEGSATDAVPGGRNHRLTHPGLTGFGDVDVITVMAVVGKQGCWFQARQTSVKCGQMTRPTGPAIGGGIEVAEETEGLGDTGTVCLPTATRWLLTTRSIVNVECPAEGGAESRCTADRVVS